MQCKTRRSICHFFIWIFVELSAKKSVDIPEVIVQRRILVFEEIKDSVKPQKCFV